MTAISTRPPNAHNRCSAISDQNFPLATRTPAHAKIFIGSENFSNTSLNQNRELGLIISSHPVMSAIAGTFASDFRNGKH